MVTLAPASTPPPPDRITTPPTPRHGYGDHWEPFAPRKSARLSSRRTSVARTPSPQPPRKQIPQNQSPRSAKRNYHDNAMSPAPSPSKKKLPPPDLSRRASGTLTAEATASAAASLGLPPVKMEASRNNLSSQTGMLPTPAKTPSRKHADQNEANIAAIARNLFHAEPEMAPSPRKKRAKQYTGLSMDSFTLIQDEEPIQIFTDSHERIPEVDNSVENPFYGPGVVAPPTERAKRSSGSNQVSIPGDGKLPLKETTHRDDGLVYVFRGKKIFRKFESDEGSSAEQDGVDGTDEAPRRLTRSSIKPRLLFPPDEKTQQAQEDEEAATDIEEQPEESNKPETPVESSAGATTPKAPKFAPASPPTSARITRASNRLVEELTPVKPTRGGKRSPFHGWRHTKTSTAGSSHKRTADELGVPAPPTKRARA